MMNISNNIKLCIMELILVLLAMPNDIQGHLLQFFFISLENKKKKTFLFAETINRYYNNIETCDLL